MTTKPAIDFAQSHKDQNLDHLLEFLRIPSISTGSEHRNDVQTAAGWLVERMNQVGIHNARLLPTGGHPVVYGEWLEAGPDAPTVLVYGHYDVQPTDPENEWVSPPFEPTIRDGYLYGRGVADDKGQLYTHLAAAEAYLRTEGKLPLNLKFFIEGEEEEGSPNLQATIEQNAAALSCDAVVISDSSFFDAQTPLIGTGVRGLVYTEVDIQGPKQDLHSGGYGGVAHNPLQVMTDILSALHDEQGQVTIPGFYDQVRPLSQEERKSMAELPFDEDKFREEEVGAPALWDGEQGYSPLERLGARPTLEIHGIRGGFVGEGHKTVIPARVSAKVSMRLVPDQDPARIAKLYEQHILNLAPPTVQVQVHITSQAHPAVADTGAPAIQAAAEAYRQGFGRKPVFLRSGGTLPVVAEFQRILQVPVVLMGYGLPDDGLHAPNEKFKLEHFYRGIDTSIYFMREMAKS